MYLLQGKVSLLAQIIYETLIIPLLIKGSRLII